ncbi:MAG TPA: hypothetical protein VK943_10805, partial [Arenibaculum sp.]|nr:hypothetical protein [Arenibaculum sp.]
RAGYSPTSARQRGSELYARPQIQDRVAVLAAHEARLEDARRDNYMSELREIRSHCKHYQQYGTALSALRAEIRLSGVKSRRVERRADDEEKEADLRARIEAELRASIEAGMQERIARIEAEAYRRARAELASELAAERAAEPELSGTNHDVSTEPDVTLPTAVSTPAISDPRAEPGLSGTFRDISGEPDHIDRLIADINGEPLRQRRRDHRQDADARRTAGTQFPPPADYHLPDHDET